MLAVISKFVLIKRQLRFNGRMHDLNSVESVWWCTRVQAMKSLLDLVQVILGFMATDW